MTAAQRQNLKDKIEADLKLLIEESWSIDVRLGLKYVLHSLEEVNLEGYDD